MPMFYLLHTQNQDDSQERYSIRTTQSRGVWTGPTLLQITNQNTRLHLCYQLVLKELDQYKVSKARNPDGVGFSRWKSASLALADLSIPVDLYELMESWAAAKVIPQAL